MNSKPEIARRKEILRQHLINLLLLPNATLRTSDLVRDKAYYAKNVIPFLVKMGHITPEGNLIRVFDPEPIIKTLWTTKKVKTIRQIAPRKAKAIGQKMSKSMQQIIDENKSTSLDFMFGGNPVKELDRIFGETKEKKVINALTLASLLTEIESLNAKIAEKNKIGLDSISDEELRFELAKRGYSGKLTKTVG